MKKAKLISAVCLAVVSLLASSCQNSLEPSTKKSTIVGLSVSDSQTRSHVEATQSKSVWEEDDRISVWAKASDGSYVLENQIFSLMASKSSTSAYFTSTIDGPMPEGSYTYYIAYPVPQQVNGTTALFNLPAIQDGKASEGIDITVAEPAVGGALQEINETKPIDDGAFLNIRMKHLLHFLRFYIPDSSTGLGEPVTKIEITMPKGIAGTVSADFTTGKASLSNPGTGMTLILDEPISSGDGRYAVAGIFPPSEAYTAGDYMEITLYSEGKVGTVDPIWLSGRDFKAGHITSVPLKVSQTKDYYTTNIRLASNKLGEEPVAVTMALPAGVNWPGTESNIYSWNKEDGIMVGESITLSTEFQSEFLALSGQNVSVSYESENAIVSETVTLGDLSSVTRADISLNCPYLFFEDFSGISSFSSSDNHSGSNVGDKNPVLFGDGWSIARAGGEAGKSVRMAAHREWFATYDSRCDSPMLSAIKDGKSVDVELTFNYSMGRDEGGLGSGPKLGATVHVGSTSTSGGIKSASTDGTFVESFNVNEDTGSYDNVDNEHTTVISNMTNARRLSWREVADGSASTTNGTYWLYLDNIRVSIKK